MIKRMLLRSTIENKVATGCQLKLGGTADYNIRPCLAMLGGDFSIVGETCYGNKAEIYKF